MLGEALETFDLAPSVIGDGKGEHEEDEFHKDPADALETRRQHLINEVDSDGAALAYGHAHGNVGDPDEDVAGNFFGPYRSAGAFDEGRDEIAVDDLPGDEENDGKKA